MQTVRRGTAPPPTRMLTRRMAAERNGFDRAYWLQHCEGFRVDADAGRVGFVEEVRREHGESPTLVVRAGVLGIRRLLVPSSEVAFIVPRAKRIWLNSPVGIIGSESSAP